MRMSGRGPAEDRQTCVPMKLRDVLRQRAKRRRYRVELDLLQLRLLPARRVEQVVRPEDAQVPALQPHAQSDSQMIVRSDSALRQRLVSGLGSS